MIRHGQNHPVCARFAARLLLAAVLCLPLAEATAAAAHDLRVVIDISGSMKQTDPLNLRVPALRLLSELLPPDTEAGVWTFGQWVNMLVAHGEVTKKWKDLARIEAAKISSVALFTDIGQALQRATRGWEGPAEGQRRSLILLTDGHVDIDKNPELNGRARAQILGVRLPALIAAGVTLYPVGLSDNADQELLETLARETGGLHQTARRADDLHRIFMNILEQSTEVNTLPIVEGGFEVDAAIDELNIVVFRNDGGRVALRDPAGSEMTRDSRPRAVRWFEENPYAVITVPDPQEGRWQILTEPHPDNRVFIISRLQLLPEALPDTLFAGEELTLRARLVDGETPIEDTGVLQLLKTQAVIEHEQDATSFWPLQPTDDPGNFQGNGRFAGRTGLSSILFVAEGPTFHRSARRLVTLAPSPFSARWEGPSWVGKAGRITLQASSADFASDELGLTVLWTGPGAARHGSETRLPVGGSQSLLFAPAQPGAYQAQVAVAGISADGRGLLIHLPPVSVDAVVEPEVSPPPPPEPEPVAVSEPAPISVPAPRPVMADGIEGRWWLGFGVINLLLVPGALYYALRTRRRDTAAMAQRLEELEAS
ncbi:MAG: VWA domain-containing protein [Proteobacteria bacterium]|nr:MAG: VWA domain-containing protein [Pseudomonadota bacterium]